MGMFDAGSNDYSSGVGLYNNFNAPTPEELKEILERQIYQGNYNPAMEQTVSQDPTQYNQIYTDPSSRAAQMQALSQLQGIGQNGGATAIDEASINNILNQTNEAARGARGAVMQNAQERGIGGSGLDVVNQQLANQSAATNANQQGLGVTANAQARALQAIQQSGQLGGQIESQNYGEAANKAAAQDAINRFNTQNSQAIAGTNTGASNQAALRNINTKQDVSNANTGIANQQANYNAGTVQTAFNDQLSKTNAQADQYNKRAQNEVEKQKNENAFNGQLLSTGALLVASDETKKKNIQDPDMDEFLNSLHAKSFDYKDSEAPGASDGKNVGVMAQDVEKSKVGKTMVKNTKDGKMLDMHKGFGVVLAALAALHDKMENEKGEHARV